MKDMLELEAPTDGRTYLKEVMAKKNITPLGIAEAVNITEKRAMDFLAGGRLGPEKTRDIISHVMPVRVRGPIEQIERENAERMKLMNELLPCQTPMRKPNAMPFAERLLRPKAAPTPQQKEAYGELYAQLRTLLGDDTYSCLKAAGISRKLEEGVTPVAPETMMRQWEAIEAKLRAKHTTPEATKTRNEALGLVFAMRKAHVEICKTNDSGIGL